MFSEIIKQNEDCFSSQLITIKNGKKNPLREKCSYTKEAISQMHLGSKKDHKKKDSRHFDQELSLPTASSWSRATRKAEVL